MLRISTVTLHDVGNRDTKVTSPASADQGSGTSVPAEPYTQLHLIAALGNH